MFKILDQENKSYKVVEIEDEKLDSSNSTNFKKEMLEIVKNKESVIIDLMNVEFIDSSGLGCLIALHKNLSPGQALILCGIGQSVDKIFELTCLNAVFNLKQDIKEAVSSLEGTK